MRTAGRLPGVTRIALIGALATDEPEPKDADLLVTVSDEADLAPLATPGRKLNGHSLRPRSLYWCTCPARSVVWPGLNLSIRPKHVGTNWRNLTRFLGRHRYSKNPK